MKNLEVTLMDLIRLKDVKRWQIVRVDREQNVAEHSYLVAMIALKLLAQIKESKPEVIIDLENVAGLNAKHMVMECALWHDVPEVFTGDINTPTKLYLKNIPEVGAALKDLESTAGPEYQQSTYAAHPLVGHIVKLADFMEACAYLNEHGRGTYSLQQLYQLKCRMYEYADAVGLRDETEKVYISALYGHTTTFERVDALLGTEMGVKKDG